MNKRRLIFLLILCVHTPLAADESREMRHTLYIHGLIPFFIPAYNYGLAYEYNFYTIDKNFILSSQVGVQAGGAIGYNTELNISSSAKFTSGDIYVKFSWILNTDMIYIRPFFGLGVNFYEEKELLEYHLDEVNAKRTSIGSATFREIMPAYTIGIIFKPSKASRFSFGMNWSGLFSRRREVAFANPVLHESGNYDDSLAVGFVLRFVFGYSF